MGGVERSRTNMEQKRGSLAKAICGTANDGQLRPVRFEMALTVKLKQMFITSNLRRKRYLLF